MSDSLAHHTTPDDPALDWGLSFAQGYLELGMLHQAEQALDRLPAKYHEHPAVMSLRSHVLVARRRWRRVVAHAQHAVRKYPQAPEYYIHAATAFDMMGRREEGRRVWESAPDLVRTSGAFHLHVARFEARLGNIDAARDHLASALDLDPRLRTVAGRDPHLLPVLETLSAN